MTEHPIIFSGEMVRAIMDGRKTQSRRVIKAKREGVITGPAAEPYQAIEAYGGGKRHIASRIETRPCPYGKPGDRLWVRERWTAGISLKDDKTVECADFPEIVNGKELMFGASDDFRMGPGYEGTEQWARLWKLKPSIHMPRWASRILLEVTGVRVERVQEISDEDARADCGKDRCCMADGHGPVVAFHGLWDSINDKRGFGWDVNPWVWVVEFRRIDNGK